MPAKRPQRWVAAHEEPENKCRPTCYGSCRIKKRCLRVQFMQKLCTIQDSAESVDRLLHFG